MVGVSGRAGGCSGDGCSGSGGGGATTAAGGVTAGAGGVTVAFGLGGRPRFLGSAGSAEEIFISLPDMG